MSSGSRPIARAIRRRGVRGQRTPTAHRLLTVENDASSSGDAAPPPDDDSDFDPVPSGDTSSSDDVSSDPPPAKRRGAKGKRSKRKRESTSTSRGPARAPGECPPKWEEVWAGISKMREARDAVVDSMGCERLGNTEATPEVYRFQTLVSLMLSSQTKDEITAEAVDKLNKGIQGGLTIDGILGLTDTELNGMIRRVGFHNRKTQYIKRTAAILKEKWGGDIPPDIPGLVSLPGVGKKMAYLAMQVAWKHNVGIGVDVHVHRICNRLHWCDTKNPEATRLAIESWLPRDKWDKINLLLVGFGQQICKPVAPYCGDCLVYDLCPSAEARKRRRTNAPSVTTTATTTATTTTSKATTKSAPVPVSIKKE